MIGLGKHDKNEKRQTESVPPNDRGWGWDARRHRDRTQGAVNNWTRRHRRVWRLDRYGDNVDDWPTQRSLRRITSATRTLATEDNPTESHQEVPVGATLDDRPTSATSRHVTIVPTAVPSTSNGRPSASFVPPSLSTPRAPKR